MKQLPWTKAKGTGKGPRQGRIGVEKGFPKVSPHLSGHQHSKPWAGVMAGQQVNSVTNRAEERTDNSALRWRRQMEDGKKKMNGFRSGHSEADRTKKR